MITVLCPSRGRPDLLTRSLRSLLDFACGPWSVEIRIAVDPDDFATMNAAENLGVFVHVTSSRYGYHDLGRYYNELAAQAVGSWLLLWNDDALMTTECWNTRIEELPHWVMVADLHTDMSPSVCAFPAVRDKAVCCVGYFCPPETSHTDSYWQDLGRRTGTISPVPVHVHHDRYDLTGNNNDLTFREGRTAYRSDEYYGSVVQRRIEWDSIKLGVT